MNLKILWPGRTRNCDIKKIQDDLFKKIGRLDRCDLIETKEARGIDEKNENQIMEIEAKGLEKYFGNDYIVCLSDKGKELSSKEFARFLSKMTSHSTRTVTFVVGGFLGLDKRIIHRADFLLSLSKMTFSHELIRLILLEQIYRSLTIMKGHQYAK
ncbi:MAG: 23S rRNA (pseudouridine(1915)-N(3))-methyltransferase RlmH [Candidatus Aminicenantes bacterium]|nr:23S rRNA (pseudouridine(1915)-N(3))-methyltransferase RlmH [Candidatus Aminicenantes bacterium]